MRRKVGCFTTSKISNNYCPMELMMYVGNDFIESVALNREFISKPGYLGAFKRSLKAKYHQMLLETPKAPEFIVVNPLPAVQGSYTAPSLN